MSTFAIKDFKLHNLDKGPENVVELSKIDALKIYSQMQNIRRLETNIGNLYKSQLVKGFCHLCNGQEACAVGVYQAMRPQDMVISSYRVHGWCYLMSGGNAFAIYAELLAKRSGISGGKGGSMHLYAKNFYGGQGIVGAQGQVFEAFNMAKLWNLPCIFVCENNEYGMGTSTSRSSANVDYYKRGDYIPGILVDGMDVLAVRQAAKYAIEYCMSDKGPIVLEFKTYRYYGHSMSDPGTSYRNREEIQHVRLTQDPIATFGTKIVDQGLTTVEELKSIDVEIRQKMDQETQRALKESGTPLQELTADVYRNYVASEDVRGVTETSRWKHFNRR